MLKTIPICQNCIERIDTYGFMCRDLMESVAIEAADACHLIIDEDYELYRSFKPVIRFLESKGYIISQEVGEDKIVLRPDLKEGFFDDEIRVFCWCDRRSELS